MIGVKSSGDYEKTRGFLGRLLNGDIYEDLDRYGRMGADALGKATPVDTGLTSRSWGYRISRDRGQTSIEWYNTNTVAGVPLVILLQYGHGTGTGGYVHGRDFINPVIRPLFDEIADAVWKRVTA